MCENERGRGEGCPGGWEGRAAHHIVLDVQVRPGLHQHPDGVGLAISTGDHQGRPTILHREDREGGVSWIRAGVRGEKGWVCVWVAGVWRSLLCLCVDVCVRVW